MREPAMWSTSRPAEPRRGSAAVTLAGAEAPAEANPAHIDSPHVPQWQAPQAPSVVPRVLLRRVLVETGPLAAFFLGFWFWDFFVATALFMATTAIAVAASLRIEDRVPVLPLASLALILLLGGLTLVLADPTFVLMRPTVANLLLGLTLAGNCMVGRPLLKAILSPGLRLSNRGWHMLTVRASLFFVSLAILNEAIWRGWGIETWVYFKVFGTVPLNLTFIALQIPLVRAHRPGGL